MYKRETEGGRSFAVSAIKFWNSLPKKTKEQKTEQSIKNSIKTFFSKTYENIDHFTIG